MTLHRGYLNNHSSQVLPYFVINKLGHLKGLPGLFTACLYSAALRYLIFFCKISFASYLVCFFVFYPDVGDPWLAGLMAGWID